MRGIADWCSMVELSELALSSGLFRYIPTNFLADSTSQLPTVYSRRGQDDADGDVIRIIAVFAEMNGLK